MKTLPSLLGALLMLTAPSIALGAPGCLTPPGGLAGWWSGDGNANDIAGTNNGALQGGATATAVGMVAQAFSFDGTNSFVKIPDSPALRPTNLTIEAWVQFASLNSAGSGGSPPGDQYIVFKQNSRSSDFEGFDLSKTRVAGGDVFRFLVSSATAQWAEIHSATLVTTGVWYHVAAVRGSNFTQLYVNGRLERQTNVAFAQNYGSLPLYFGTSGQSYWDHKLKGALDEVSLYNRALSSNEVAAIYAAGAAGKCKAVNGLTITTQPQSQGVAVGSNAAFTVAASGAPPLSYQWQFGGAAIPGATNMNLTLANAQPTDAGSYTVVVTNSAASVTSAVAVLTVLVPPAITAQPQSLTNVAGTTATFTASSSGGAPLSYQWQQNGVILGNAGRVSGATGTTLTITSVQLADAGSYTLVASNAAGTAASTAAILTVIVLPGSCLPAAAGLIGWWPGDGNANDAAGSDNGTLQGGATATAAGEVGQAFNFDGTNNYVSIPDSPILRPTNLTIEAWVRFSSLNSAGNSPAGQQYIVFKQNTRSGNFEGYSLNKTRITGGDAFSFIVASASGQLAEVQSATLVTTGAWYHVAGVRGPNFTQLYVNGRLERQMTVSFAQDYGALPVYFGTSGQAYWDHKLKGSLDEVALYNRALSSNEVAAIYAAGAAGKCKIVNGATITAQPQSQTVAAGSNAFFTVTAGGTAPLIYQWQFNGAALAGATNPNLTLASAQPTDAGNYAVIVTNSAASVTSAVAVLTVLAPPAIATQPQSLTSAAGTAAGFSAAAIGSAPLRYQWRQNGMSLADGGRINGATTNTLTISVLQPADAGSYTLVVSNGAGSVTSAVAVLTVTGPPAILTQPASQTVVAGANVSFSVTASGTAPLSYQWQENGANLSNGGNVSGATGTALTLANVQTNAAGDYQVVVTSSAGAASSAVARLTVNVLPTAPGSGRADAVVLVNSHSAKYLDFQHFIQPYLDNFGFPYAVQDIATNPPGQNISNYAVIIIGHSQLDINQTYLNNTVQANLSLAVSNGTGLVNFDNNLYVGSTGRYQFVQDIFGFTYGSGASASSVSLPPTEPSSQMHYITTRHPANDAISFRSSLSMGGITVPAGVTALALAGGKPLVAIKKYGQGRAVQWGSYDWMVSTVLGPVDGLDDLVWRGVVWSARKPFVMRGMPNLVTMRIDDAEGPFWWAHIANEMGFKPFLSFFLDAISDANAADLRGMITNGNATASIHSLTSSTMFYFDHQNETSYSDSAQANNFYVGTQWLTAHGITQSKICATHYSEIGPNAFAGLKAWGMEYVPIEVVPGTVEYATPGAPWLAGGPYRLYESPQPGQVNWPTYYADWLTVPGHPEFNGQFFNIYSEVRDAGSCGEWCPNNTDVPGTISRGTQILKRALDSMVMATVFSHEWYIHPTSCCGSTTITTSNWRAILQGITNSLAAYNPTFVTLDYACQYVRATRTSRLVSSAYDSASGRVTAAFTGKTDLDTVVYVFVGADASISSSFGTVPAFSGSSTNTVAVLTVPLLISNAPPTVGAPHFLTPFAQNGNLSLALVGEIGRACRIEASPDLEHWFEVKTVTLLDGTARISEPMTAGPHFYRATLLP